jgi:hypothetical protein
MTPVQQAVMDRVDNAVAIGVVGLTLIVCFLAIIAVRSLWS